MVSDACSLADHHQGEIDITTEIGITTDLYIGASVELNCAKKEAVADYN